MRYDRKGRDGRKTGGRERLQVMREMRLRSRRESRRSGWSRFYVRVISLPSPPSASALFVLSCPMVSVHLSWRYRLLLYMSCLLSYFTFFPLLPINGRGTLCHRKRTYLTFAVEAILRAGRRKVCEKRASSFGWVVAGGGGRGIWNIRNVCAACTAFQ